MKFLKSTIKECFFRLKRKHIPLANLFIHSSSSSIYYEKSVDSLFNQKFINKEMFLVFIIETSLRSYFPRKTILLYAHLQRIHCTPYCNSLAISTLNWPEDNPRKAHCVVQAKKQYFQQNNIVDSISSRYIFHLIFKFNELIKIWSTYIYLNLLRQVDMHFRLFI